MTRQPETPVQSINQAKVRTLVRYLMTLSEKRQVMFMRNLKFNRLQMAVSKELERMNAKREQLIPPK